jgi:hypothetical protein
MNMRSDLFWDFTRCQVVIVYRRFGQRIGPTFKGHESKKKRKAASHNVVSVWEAATSHTESCNLPHRNYFATSHIETTLQPPT